jgi:hypothetical protein
LYLFNRLATQLAYASSPAAISNIPFDLAFDPIRNDTWLQVEEVWKNCLANALVDGNLCLKALLLDEGIERSALSLSSSGNAFIALSRTSCRNLSSWR